MTFWDTLISVTAALVVILLVLYALPLLLVPIALLAWVWCAEWWQEREKPEGGRRSRNAAA